ncbi:MAG: hypothetical protein JNG85_10335 [Spirochaetaceae bacterium]|nr:hypothetical protein [Spirochaetaceae bacterium]
MWKKSTLAVLCFLVLASAPPLAAQSLEDQFGVGTDFGAAAAGGGFVMVWSDRRSAGEDLSAWAAALAPALPAPWRLVAVADFRGLPFFVPKGGIVKQLQADSPKRPVLLDWKGEAATRLGVAKGGPAAIVVGAKGAVLAQVRGPSDAKAVAAVLAALR